jgi:hypothetical protein
MFQMKVVDLNEIYILYVYTNFSRDDIYKNGKKTFDMSFVNK